MTNDQILSLATGLGKISPPNMGGFFNYAISANLEAAVAQAKHIREAIKDSDEMVEYRKKLQDLQDTHSEKDDDDKPVQQTINLPNGSQIIQYKIPAAMDPESEFSVKLKVLNEEYSKEIKKQEKRLKFLDEENKEFKPVWIKPDDLPTGLNRGEMNLLLMLIKKD